MEQGEDQVRETQESEDHEDDMLQRSSGFVHSFGNVFACVLSGWFSGASSRAGMQ